MMPCQNEGVFRFLRPLLEILRELGLALIGQPSRPGPTRAEQRVNQIQRENLPGQLQVPASALDAAKQIGKEVGKAAILQPSAPPQRRRAKAGDDAG